MKKWCGQSSFSLFFQRLFSPQIAEGDGGMLARRAADAVAPTKACCNRPRRIRGWGEKKWREIQEWRFCPYEEQTLMRNLIPLNSSCFWDIWIKDHTKMLSPWHWWTWKNHNADHSFGQEEDMKYTRNVCITNIMNKCRYIYIYIYILCLHRFWKIHLRAPSVLSANLSLHGQDGFFGAEVSMESGATLAQPPNRIRKNGSNKCLTPRVAVSA